MTETTWSRCYLDAYRAGFLDGLAAGQAGETQMPQFTDLPIEALGLSARPLNALRAHGCTRIADMLRLSEKNIFSMRQLGKKSADEVARSLRTQGIFPTAWDSFLL